MSNGLLCIKVNSSTRLGNWMFQYAVAKSKANGGAVAFWSPDVAKLDEVKKFSEIYPEAKFVTELPPDAEVIEGLNQDPRLFDEMIVRRAMVCPERIRCFIVEKWGDVIRRPNLVSIHVRRGDYLLQPHRHPFVGKAYLKKAVETMRSPGCEYVVCSDDIPWCKKFFTARNFPETVFHFIEGGSALSDLFVATFCQHNICSNSTFSWWGAWLNRHKGKRVIFPSKWYGVALKDMPWNMLYFNGSEVMENHYTVGAWAKAVLCMSKTVAGNALRKAGLR